MQTKKTNKKGFIHIPNTQLSSGARCRKMTTASLVVGFTVIEAMIALVLIMVTVVSAFTAVQSSISLLTSSKNNITARFLAQGALEYVHYVRDKQLYLHDRDGGNTDWLSGFERCGRNNPCSIDTSDPTNVIVDECFGGSCAVLEYCTQDNSGNKRQLKRYGYSPGSTCANWIDTLFTREITIKEIDDTGQKTIGVGQWGNVREIVVTATVSWEERGKPKKIVYEQNFLNFVDRP